ncbi:MAG: hypothetical protein JWP92_3011 [Caulobacter sp.]|nr:hypothetical protein [Caulobacter sp.]
MTPTPTRRSLFLAGALLLVAGCATAPRPVPIAQAPGAGPQELEPLHAVTADRDGLTIRVTSGGCTKKEDFAFYVERKGSEPTIAFARKRLDICRSFAAAHADLTFSYAELGVSNTGILWVLNPITPFRGPVKPLLTPSG